MNRLPDIHGIVAPGFEAVRDTLARQFQEGRQIGAAFSVWQGEEPVVDIWAGVRDKKTQMPWVQDTRVVVFSVTKGFVAMALHLLADRGLLEWDLPVAHYWPGFAQNGKQDITVRTLLNHEAGLYALSHPLLASTCCKTEKKAEIVALLEKQRPHWQPGTKQGYHAITFGLYAAELFYRIAGETVGAFLRREVFEPTGSDVFLGTPASQDDKFATLYPPGNIQRVLDMAQDRLAFPHTPDARVLLDFLKPISISRSALTRIQFPFNRLTPYNSPDVYRHELCWASATGTARGVARAYIPWIQDGRIGDRRLFSKNTARQPIARQGWSERDLVLQKPTGWACGFVKEASGAELGANPEAFGHHGLGGTVGFADPKAGLAVGYVHNRMSWRIQPRRTLELVRALYTCV